MRSMENFLKMNLVRLTNSFILMVKSKMVANMHLQLLIRIIMEPVNIDFHISAIVVHDIFLLMKNFFSSSI